MKNGKKIYYNDEGFILVVTLWILAIISILLLTFTFSVNISIKNASYLKDDIVEKGMTIAAINRLKASLVYPKDRNKKEKDTKSTDNKQETNKSKSDSNNSTQNNKEETSKTEKENDPKTKEENKKRAEWYWKMLGKWYVYIKDWRLSREKELNNDSSDYVLCIITAEDSKFDLKKIKDIEKLDGYSNDILINIKEKFKEDKNFRITCVPQLLMINGVEGENYDGDDRSLKGLKNTVTTFSDGKVYVNNANSSALAFIPGIDQSTAQLIAENKDLISSFDKLRELIGTSNENTEKKLEKWLKFIPEYFKITAYRKVNGIDVKSEAVLSIKNGQIELLSLK